MNGISFPTLGHDCGMMSDSLPTLGHNRGMMPDSFPSLVLLGDSGLVKEMPSGRRGCLCTAVGPQGISVSSRITLKNGHDKKGRTHPTDAYSLELSEHFLYTAHIYLTISPPKKSFSPFFAYI